MVRYITEMTIYWERTGLPHEPASSALQRVHFSSCANSMVLFPPCKEYPHWTGLVALLHALDGPILSQIFFSLLSAALLQSHLTLCFYSMLILSIMQIQQSVQPERCLGEVQAVPFWPQGNSAPFAALLSS